VAQYCTVPVTVNIGEYQPSCAGCINAAYRTPMSEGRWKRKAVPISSLHLPQHKGRFLSSISSFRIVISYIARRLLPACFTYTIVVHSSVDSAPLVASSPICLNICLSFQHRRRTSKFTMQQYSVVPLEPREDVAKSPEIAGMSTLTRKVYTHMADMKLIIESKITAELSDDTQHRIGDWPTEPKTLREATPSQIYKLLPHMVLLIMPIASVCMQSTILVRFNTYDIADSVLAVLGVAVVIVNGKAESRAGKILKQAMAVTSTLWPILFAAVVGPMLRAAALYRAERGAKLGVSTDSRGFG
jgi:hypothetical protein